MRVCVRQLPVSSIGALQGGWLWGLITIVVVSVLPILVLVIFVVILEGLTDGALTLIIMSMVAFTRDEARNLPTRGTEGRRLKRNRLLTWKFVASIIVSTIYAINMVSAWRALWPATARREELEGVWVKQMLLLRNRSGARLLGDRQRMLRIMSDHLEVR